MNAFVVSILVNGKHDGYLGYHNNEWRVYWDIIDALLFTDEYDAAYEAETYIRHTKEGLYIIACTDVYGYKVKKVILQELPE